MFTLHIDLKLRYSPLMPKDGGCITLTRQTEIPFAPQKGLIVYSAFFDRCPKPEGAGLRDVIWDFDRRVFLATVCAHDAGLPIGAIVADLKDLLDRGWSLGSYRDSYTGDSSPAPARL